MELETVCLQMSMGVVHLKLKYLHDQLNCRRLCLISCLFAPSGLSKMQSSGGFSVCVPELWGHTEELNKEHPYPDPATAFRDRLALVHLSDGLFQSVQERHSAASASAALLCVIQLFLILFTCLLI